MRGDLGDRRPDRQAPSVRVGYKVIFVPFAGGKPSGIAIDVLTGFVRDNGDAMGRPVGVAIDRRGALLVADDVGNAYGACRLQTQEQRIVA